MALLKILKIKETLSELQKIKKEQNNFQQVKRLIWLELLITNRFKKRKDLCHYLDINPRTSERWVNRYIYEGLEGLLNDGCRKRKSTLITSDIHNALEEKVNSSTNSFLGYWDAQQWVKDKFGKDIKYHTIRKYLIKHFKTKLKSPRKSHYKKSEDAEKAFLKTS